MITVYGFDTAPDRDSLRNGVSAPTPGWSELVERIRAGEPSAMEDLYREFCHGVRYQLQRRLGARDLDDNVHDVFVAVAQSISRGELREPARLMGFVQRIVIRQASAYIEAQVRARNKYLALNGGILRQAGPDPEHRAIERQRRSLLLRVLNGIPKRDREILERFYLREQKPPEICREMDLTETQFRIFKSRAKARFVANCRNRLALKRAC
jgi:RNA polymerase sigma factor (sigma-70 family)